MPTISNGKKVAEIKESVLNLNSIARVLKQKRIANGSLRLDATKLKFALDSETGVPIAVAAEEVNSTQTETLIYDFSAQRRTIWLRN
jgi:exoribonuclease R